MIRYRPVRNSISLSLKEEQVFQTVSDMLQYVFGRCVSYALYVGSRPPSFGDLAVVPMPGDDPATGYRNECMVTLRRVHCVGYCGE